MCAFEGGHDLTVAPYASGPQDAEQVPQEIRTLLDQEYTEFVVILRNIDGRKCGQYFHKIEKP